MRNLRKNIFLVCVSFIGASSIAWAQIPCAGLKTFVLPDTTIETAAPVPAGPLAIPGTPRSVKVPAFCRVTGAIWPEIRFELWMPEGWNGKLLNVGNGGLAGSINYTGMLAPLQSGYATGSTDTGHTSEDPDWALGHFQRIADFGYRAIHVMTQADKAILRAFYGTGPEHSYFNGCSNGGRQALIEAQRYPADYDGIIAGDPAADWTRLYTGGHLWTMRALDGDAYLPEAKIPVLAKAVREACDALDGLADGLLSDPRRCHFDPSTLECPGADHMACFTSAQIGAIRKLWNGARNAEGLQIFPGLVPGSEDGPDGWATWISGRGPGRGSHAGLGLPALRYMIFENPEWDFRMFRYDNEPGFDNDVDFVDRKLGPVLNAINPDLRAFQALGGKLIQYHGWSDPDISPLTSIEYYEQVKNTIGQETPDFYRLFLMPGMQHCDGTGPGPNRFDMTGALDAWVEQRKMPDSILASHETNGKVDRTRPVCAYPREARWTGNGSPDEAANFTCVLPGQP